MRNNPSVLVTALCLTAATPAFAQLIERRAEPVAMLASGGAPAACVPA